MGRILLRSLTIDFRMRIGKVEVERLECRAGGHQQVAVLAGLSQVFDHLRLCLDVPGEVEVTGLNYRTASANSVAAALDENPREIRLVRLAIALVDDIGALVVRPELLQHVRSGSDRVGLELREIVCRVIPEDVRRQDRADTTTGERVEPIDRRRGIGDGDRPVVDNLDVLDRLPLLEAR